MVLSESETRIQLQRILISPGFASSARSSQFLRFCVEQTLEGKHEVIKESTIGIEVFGRSPGFDPKADAIVRVHARRVREKLEHYYSASGTQDPIEIKLPKGGYVPIVLKRFPSPRTTDADRVLWIDVAPPPTANRRFPAVLWALVIFLSVVTLAAVFAYLHQAQRAPSPRTGTELIPFTSFPGTERNPSWSPDGKTLAYSWSQSIGGIACIYLQRIGETEPHRLTNGTEAEFRPVWSPDGHEIAFLRPSYLNHFQVVRHNVVSGSERVLASLSYFWILPEDHPALDWSPDGKQLLVAEQPSPTAPVRLILLSASTGESHPLTDPPYGTSGDLEGKFSPDGNLVAFRRGGLGDLYLVSTEGEAKNPAKQLTFDNRGVRGIAWSADGRSILYGSHRDPTGFGVWEVSSTGGTEKGITPYGFEGISPAVSRDGTRLALERRELVVNLVAEPLSDTQRRQILAPSNRLDYAPTYSPDGQQIAFISTRSGPEELWVERVDGTGLQQLTHVNGKGIPLTVAWSPDGRRIVTSIRSNGPTNLFLVDIRSGEMQQLTSSSNRFVSPIFSKDGKFLYFSSNAQGQSRIWRLSSDGSGKPEQMFGDPAIYFQQSEDGRFLYFADQGPELRIVSRDLETGALKTVFHNSNLSPFNGFIVRGRTLYVILQTGSNLDAADVVAVHLATGSIEKIAHLNHVSRGIPSGFAISPDGKSLIVAEVEQDNSDIYLMPLSVE